MDLKKYKPYTILDFIQDEDFIRWVKDPTTEDKLFWRSFVLSHPDKKQEIEEAKAIVSAMVSPPIQPELSPEEKADMLYEMRQKNQGGQNQHLLVAHRNRRRRQLLAAAAAVLLIGVGAWTWFNVKKAITVTTTYSQQQSVELPDGSLVKLNANSSLTYNKKWDKEESRKVWLRGEAFFEVEKKVETSQKFQVITKDLTVEVLGTVFNVNSHQEATKVFLEEGKIKLNLHGMEQAMLMEPGELVAYSESKKEPPKKRKVLPTVQTSWKDGLQLFDKTPLSEVLEKLEEFYGVTIQVKDTAHYATEINTGLPVENLEEALSVLEATLVGLKIIKKENGYVIQ